VTEYAAAMHEVADALLSQELITGDVVREAVARTGGNPQPMPQTTA
jgi:cell division protease FtsH